MTTVLLLNKPYNTLSQFTDSSGRNTLADLITETKYKDFYAAGRLDLDSEGLLLLTNSGDLQHRIAHPAQKLEKVYWVQVEGAINPDALNTLRNGVALKDGKTKPAKAQKIPEPKDLWQRTPPVRRRENIPTSWVEIRITEGKNRQVRRMTAAVGFPTLRLIRAAIGPWRLSNLKPGEFREETIHLPSPTKKKHHKNSKRPRAAPKVGK